MANLSKKSHHKFSTQSLLLASRNLHSNGVVGICVKLSSIPDLPDQYNNAGQKRKQVFSGFVGLLGFFYASVPKAVEEDQKVDLESC